MAPDSACRDTWWQERSGIVCDRRDNVEHRLPPPTSGTHWSSRWRRCSPLQMHRCFHGARCLRVQLARWQLRRPRAAVTPVWLKPCVDNSVNRDLAIFAHSPDTRIPFSGAQNNVAVNDTRRHSRKRHGLASAVDGVVQVRVVVAGVDGQRQTVHARGVFPVRGGTHLVRRAGLVVPNLDVVHNKRTTCTRTRTHTHGGSLNTCDSHARTHARKHAHIRIHAYTHGSSLNAFDSHTRTHTHSFTHPHTEPRSTTAAPACASDHLPLLQRVHQRMPATALPSRSDVPPRARAGSP